MAPQFDSPAASPDSFSKPKPRAPKSPERMAQIRKRNRRREYLERNPGYFKSTEHELADPVLYDTFIRRFQTPAEREAEGNAKGFGRLLEGSLLRGEAKLERMAASYASDGPHISPTSALQSSSSRPQQQTSFSVEPDIAAPPADKEEGRQRWQEFLLERFVHGGDEDFEYGKVDEEEEFDVLERREAEERWFDEEEEGWATDEGKGEKGGREGETGIQDF